MAAGLLAAVMLAPRSTIARLVPLDRRAAPAGGSRRADPRRARLPGTTRRHGARIRDCVRLSELARRRRREPAALGVAGNRRGAGGAVLVPNESAAAAAAAGAPPAYIFRPTAHAHQLAAAEAGHSRPSRRVSVRARRVRKRRRASRRAPLECALRGRSVSDGRIPAGRTAGGTRSFRRCACRLGRNAAGPPGHSHTRRGCRASRTTGVVLDRLAVDVTYARSPVASTIGRQTGRYAVHTHRRRPDCRRDCARPPSRTGSAAATGGAPRGSRCSCWQCSR